MRFGAGHCHIKHPALLLNILCEHRFIIRCDPLIDIRKKNALKLQPLLSMHGHKHHRILRLSIVRLTAFFALLF